MVWCGADYANEICVDDDDWGGVLTLWFAVMIVFVIDAIHVYGTEKRTKHINA